MDDQYINNYESKSTGKLIGIGMLFFLFGVIITFIVCIVIYKFILQNKQSKYQDTVEPTIVNDIKLPEDNIDIDDSVDSCIQKRKIYDSDFDKLIYPINDNEIIYF